MGRYKRKINRMVSGMELLIIAVTGKYACLSDLKNILRYMVLAVAIGGILYPVSVLIHDKLDFTRLRLFYSSASRFPCFVKEHRQILYKYMLVAAVEELFWRGVVQGIFFDSIPYVFFITFIFTAIHFIRKEIYLYSFLEFFIYFSGISCIYMATGNIYPAILIHFIRNVSISFMDYIQSKAFTR